MQIEDSIESATYDEAMGMVKLPEGDKLAEVKEKNYQVTCRESAEPVIKKQVMNLHIETDVRPAQSKIVELIGGNYCEGERGDYYYTASIRGNIATGKILYGNGGFYLSNNLKDAQASYGASANYVKNPLGDWVNDPGLSLTFLGSNHYDHWTDLFTPPTRSNGYVALFYIFKHHARSYHLRWRASIPQKTTYKDEKWISTDPSIDELEKQGACIRIEEECTQEQGTRNINGLPVTKDCWQKNVTYECGGGSNLNECAELENKGCWQVASKCTKKEGPFPVEFEQTFECPGANFQNGVVVTDGSLKIGAGADPMTGDTFGGEDFAEAIGKFNLVKEMRKDLVPEPPDQVRVFKGQPLSCDIDFGSGIKNCCRLKGLLMNVMGSKCPKDVTDTLAPAVVKDKRCQLIEEKYCIKEIKVGVAKICRKWRTTYCCFNSKLAKIFQQIAHIQLGISWGTGESPNCGSLSPADFVKLNFDAPEAQGLLAEVINEVHANAEQSMQLAQQRLAARANLTERVKEMQVGLTDHMKKKFPNRPEGIQQ